MPATSPPSLEEALGEGSVWEAAPPEDTHDSSSPPSDDTAALPGGHHIPGGFDLNIIAPLGHSAVDQQLLEDCLRMYQAIGYVYHASSLLTFLLLLPQPVRVIPACTHALT